MENQYQLAQEITALSETNSWVKAKLEWSLESVFSQEEPDTCLCGHFPIKEICLLRNRFNGNSAIVGNVCVKKFLGLPSDKIFQAVRRVRKDDTKSFNLEAIEFAYRKEWVNDWEAEFYLDIMRKRNLSPRQLEVKRQINEKLLRGIVRARSNDSPL